MDITVSIIFHKEAAYAVPALASMKLLVSATRSVGLTVEARALMDNADEATTQIVEQQGDWLYVVDFRGNRENSYQQPAQQNGRH